MAVTGSLPPSCEVLNHLLPPGLCGHPFLAAVQHATPASCTVVGRSPLSTCSQQVGSPAGLV